MLCLLATLKTRLGITSSGDDDTLTGLANWVHDLFDQWCNRTFQYHDGIDHIASGSVCDISLPCYPIQSILSITYRDNSRSAWRAVTGAKWLVDLSSGIFTITSGPIGSDNEQVRVLYSGGYVLPGETAADGQTALPTSISEAAIAQTMHLYESRHLHLPAATGNSPAKAARDIELLPQVELTLQPYRRMRL